MLLPPPTTTHHLSPTSLRWIESQRAQWQRQRYLSLDPSVESLIRLMECFILLLERSHGVQAHIPYFQ